MVDAKFSINGGYFNKMTRDISALEAVKFGSNTRDDLHSKQEEGGRVDLVFKGDDQHGRHTTVCLLFPRPADAIDFTEAEGKSAYYGEDENKWVYAMSGMHIAPFVALGLKEFCKSYVVELKTNGHRQERNQDRDTHSSWMDLSKQENRRQLVHGANIRQYKRRCSGYDATMDMMNATNTHTIHADEAINLDPTDAMKKLMV